MPVSWAGIIPQRPIPIISEELQFENTERAQALELSVYKSPLRNDGYKVSLYVSVREDPPSQKGLTVQLRSMFGRQPPDGLNCSVLYSFLFCCLPTASPPIREATWKLLSVVPAAHFVQGSPALTLSGYGVDSPVYGSVCDALYERDGIEFHGGREVMPRQMSGKGTALGIYSAAILELEERSLRISYFV